MKIEDYEFGRIRIDGKDYVNDVIILPDLDAALIAACLHLTC